MFKPRNLFPALVIFSLFLLPSSALADPVVFADPFIIDSGTIDLSKLPGGNFISDGIFYNYAGPGISVTGRFGEFFGAGCGICQPGSRAGLSGNLFGGGGTVTLNGISYDVFFGGQSRFSTPGFDLPPVPPAGSEITMTAPFTMTGTLFGCTVQTLICEERHIAFRAAFSGQGLATGVYYVSRLPGNQAYYITDLTYNFQPSPVPEPTTLLLLATGLAGVAAKVRKRRKDSR